MKCKKCDNTNNSQDKYCISCETQPQDNKAAKNIIEKRMADTV